MSKRKINTDKSWWAKSPNRELELLELAGLTGGHKYDFLGHYGQAMKVFYNKKQNSAYIQKSVIMKTMKISPRRSTTINKVLSNRWLFYTMPLHKNSDVLLQPIFDMTKMTETKFNNMLKAVYEQNMEKLLKLCPNILPTPDQYSKGLYSEEEMSDKTNLENDAETECHETVARQSLDGQETVTRPSRDTQNDQSLLKGTQRDKERESKSEKENQSFSQSKEVNRNLLEETETDFLSFSDKKTDYKTDSGETLEDYVNGLKLGSKEVDSLFDFAGDEAEFFRSNFDKFKLKFMNRAKLLGKDKELDGQSQEKKNLYLYNVLRKPAFRKELVKDIKESLVFKIQSEFRYHKEGYKWDLFNKDGDRMSQGKIIPRDAPPQPSPEHFWDFDYNMWVH